MAAAAWEGIYLTGVVAGADLSAAQYYVVKLGSTANSVIKAAAATDSVVGILQNDPASGEEAVVGVIGVFKAAGEASITKGDWVAASTTGRVKTTSTGNDDVVGKALEATTTAGDIIPVLVGGPSNF